MVNSVNPKNFSHRTPEQAKAEMADGKNGRDRVD